VLSGPEKGAPYWDKRNEADVEPTPRATAFGCALISFRPVFGPFSAIIGPQSTMPLVKHGLG